MNDLQTASELITGLNGGNTPALSMIYTLTLVALLPSIVIMMTSFVRTIIILSFTRNALGVQQSPPNMVLVGISLFLTLYIMAPTITQIREEAYQPYQQGQITQEEALEKMQVPVKEFMLKNTETKTLNRFVRMAKIKKLKNPKEYPLTIVTPAFMTSELKRGFMAGFLIYLPFLLIDVVVATTLMAMGMAMMPPTMVAMPFKLLLFISVNGWELLFSTIVSSFR
jgi:flagellar biosynthetic protein FliP